MKKIDIEVARHSLAHVMAQAMHRLHKNVNQGVGPAIENGFYQDFVLPKSFKGAEELPQLKKEIQKLIKENLEFVKKQVSKKEALKIFSYDKYKSEMINELPGDKVTVYTCGEYRDLCKGPHLEKTGQLKQFAWQLERIAGAYWKGDEKNIMMTRIYGLAFESKEELKKHIQLIQEAKNRDHRKLGKELDLFVFSDIVGPGLPLFTPNGVIIIDELKKHIETICYKYGFEKVMTPHLAKIDLYETSGHAAKFADELFHVSSKHKQEYVMKPVQCPHQIQIFASKPRSYRDLPVRYMESEKQYRAEKPGEIGGLNRVIAITIEDGHIFCTPEQMKDEIKNLISSIKDFYAPFKLLDKSWVSLSVRDYDHPEKYIGEPKDWDKAEKVLAEVCDELKLNSKRCEGEAALYGPKIDFMFTDFTGKEIQIPTVQLDFATPQRFKLEYTDEKGNKKIPVMLHRAVLGSYERILALLIEHYAGAFPLWLSPIQIQVIPVGEGHHKFAEKLQQEFIEAGIRAKSDDNDETVGNKIRKAAKNKIPYILVVGDKEAKCSDLSIKERGKEEVYSLDKKKFIDLVLKQIKDKK